jgi:hypothetical protein
MAAQPEDLRYQRRLRSAHATHPRPQNNSTQIEQPELTGWHQQQQRRYHERQPNHKGLAIADGITEKATK